MVGPPPAGNESRIVNRRLDMLVSKSRTLEGGIETETKPLSDWRELIPPPGIGGKDLRRRRDRCWETGVCKALFRWAVSHQSQSVCSEPLRRLVSALRKDMGGDVDLRLETTRFVEPPLVDPSMQRRLASPIRNAFKS